MGKCTLTFGGKTDESDMETTKVDKAATKDAMEGREKA